MAVFDRTSSVEETTNKLQEFAQKVRKEDLLSLENETITDPFMARAVRLAVDGVPVDTIRQTLEDEMTSLKDRHDSAQGIFQFMGDIAPAMGMIGTLIGLVQMLQNLDDPSSIGLLPTVLLPLSSNPSIRRAHHRCTELALQPPARTSR